MLLEHSHSCHHTRLAASGQFMKSHVAGNHVGRKLCISSSPSTTTSDIISDIMDLNMTFQHAVSWMTLARTFSQFLSATIGPSVARVSAPSMTPSLNMQPTMVVPVLVAFGKGTPCDMSSSFLKRKLEKLRLPNSQNFISTPRTVAKVKASTAINLASHGCRRKEEDSDV